MIKLENTTSLPQAHCLLVVESRGSGPGVSLVIDEAKEKVGDEWTVSQMNVRQVVTCFIDGKPFKLEGKLAAEYAVECAACHKAVVQVEAKMSLSSAFEKGDKSRQVVELALVRVVEVWSTPTKKLWSVADAQAGNGHAAPVAEMGSNGRIQKSEAVATR